ncbi:MAG: phosphoenolpyruvate synthase, partial [Desulfobulbaceae bacterium]|nr:phosphoenolpyruvate synthase [Desulfobulbaceae bacterium]
MNGVQDSVKFTSDALRANLEETAGEVVVDPVFDPLREAVGNYQGLAGKLDMLLLEIHHPYRNWGFIIPELRAFVLKNMSHYLSHDLGPECFRLFSGIFLEALVDSRKNSKLVSMIMEAMLAYTDKLVNAISPRELSRYEKECNDFFARLIDLDQVEGQLMMYMVQGHHPMKKVARKLVAFSSADPAVSFDYGPVARLMSKILALNYQYWLSEEDPLPWFLEECGEYCHDWHAGPLLAAVSHEQIRKYRDELAAIPIEGDARAALTRILELPNHMDLVRLYREIPGKLARDAEADATFAENRKLLFLFRIMDTSGLYLIHEETLR